MGHQTEDVDALLDGGTGKRLAYVEVQGHPADRSIQLPLAVVQGAQRGPTVWVNASLHGDEYLGPAACVSLLRRLDPAVLRGRVLLSPALNLGAVRAMQRTDPADPRDLNRIWSAGERAAVQGPAVPWADSALLSRADAVIDLHSGGNRFLQAPFTVFSRVGGDLDGRSSDLAKACGLPLVWAHQDAFLAGALISEAARRGRPAVLIEMEGEGKAEPAWVDRMVAAVEGALGHLGLLPRVPPWRPSSRVFENLTVVRSHGEGLWARAVDPAAPVSEGGVLGSLLDFLGEEVERVASPVEGVVVGICTYGFVPRNDYVAEIAHGFHAEGPPG